MCVSDMMNVKDIMSKQLDSFLLAQKRRIDNYYMCRGI